MNIVFIAAPAAGKGTQAAMLKDEFNMYHLSTGDLLREVSKTDMEVKNLIDNGKLISDELMLKLLKEKINSLDTNNGIIFDGFPRTINQAHMLDELLSSMNQKIDHVIFLDVEKDIAAKRAVGRVTCSQCNAIFNVYFDEIKEEGKCNNCNGTLEKRSDDTIEKFNNRFDTYINSTKPVIDYYKEKNILSVVSSDGDKLDIYNNIKSIIGGLND